MLSLLSADQNTISTTLLVLPFAFPNFLDFYDFSMELEDDILPKIERGSVPDISNTVKESEIQVLLLVYFNIFCQ